jgi:hypothetical protein
MDRYEQKRIPLVTKCRQHQFSNFINKTLNSIKADNERANNNALSVQCLNCKKRAEQLRLILFIKVIMLVPLHLDVLV